MRILGAHVGDQVLSNKSSQLEQVYDTTIFTGLISCDISAYEHAERWGNGWIKQTDLYQTKRKIFSGFFIQFFSFLSFFIFSPVVFFSLFVPARVYSMTSRIWIQWKKYRICQIKNRRIQILTTAFEYYSVNFKTEIYWWTLYKTCRIRIEKMSLST